MALYTTGSNRITDLVDIPVLEENYHGSIGASEIVLENIQNDLAIFESLIMDDYTQIRATHENASEEQLEALMEASMVGYVIKLKELLDKLWAKVQQLVDTAIKHIMSIVVVDNKKFVEKYEKDVDNKTFNKMKYKWSMCRGNKSEVFAGKQNPEQFKLKAEGLPGTSNVNFNALIKTPSDKLDKMITDNHSQDTKEKVLAKNLGLNGSVEWSKAFDEYRQSLFEDNDEHEGLDRSLLKNIMENLKTSKDTIKAFNNAKSEAKSIYNKRLSALKEAESVINKADNDQRVTVKTDDNSTYNTKVTRDNRTSISKALQLLRKDVVFEQDVAIKTISVMLQTYKWKVKECRSVFSRAVVYNSAKNESAEYLDGIDDVAYHEIEELFEGVYAY